MKARMEYGSPEEYQEKYRWVCTNCDAVLLHRVIDSGDIDWNQIPGFVIDFHKALTKFQTKHKKHGEVKLEAYIVTDEIE